jgi:hypothetical protein
MTLLRELAVLDTQRKGWLVTEPEETSRLRVAALVKGVRGGTKGRGRAWVQRAKSRFVRRSGLRKGRRKKLWLEHGTDVTFELLFEPHLILLFASLTMEVVVLTLSTAIIS